nr:protein DEHYDRATION-INDUCED 19 homolog 4-like [Ipomoea trifida]GMD70955.1 protein DEHYDRATION-INDUCED 19 homolog 3-like isoform X1 [Ipomoea batatas]
MADQKSEVDILFAALKTAIRQPPPALSKKKLQNRLNTRGHSGLSLLRKELQNLNLHLHLKESSRADSSSNADADRLMLSFVNSPQSTYRVETMQAKNSAQTSLLGRSEENSICERSTQAYPVDEDQAEKVQRCDFVSGILFSTILDDFL